MLDTYDFVAISGANGKTVSMLAHCYESFHSYRPLVFKIACDTNSGPALLREALIQHGMVEFDHRVDDRIHWNLWWKGCRFTRDELTGLSLEQRVNHHPTPVGKQADIITKDGLLRAVRRLCISYPKCARYLLLPETYHLPREENLFVRRFSEKMLEFRHTNQSKTETVASTQPHTDDLSDTESVTLEESKLNSFSNIWIVKPTDQCRGRGIYILKTLENFVYASKSVVQRYITNPLLISGYKFDLRIYAVVPSYAPFIVYIYRDGLARFATETFDLYNLDNAYAHLTNSSININGPSYMLDKAGVGPGCKWTVTRLRQWFRFNGINDRPLWYKIETMILLTLLSQASSVPKLSNAFELFGFDILIDEHLNPWLLEVNANPSLANDSPADTAVKLPLIRSILDMLALRNGSSMSSFLDSTGVSVQPITTLRSGETDSPTHIEKLCTNRRRHLGVEGNQTKMHCGKSLQHGKLGHQKPRGQQLKHNFLGSGDDYHDVRNNNYATPDPKGRNGRSLTGEVRCNSEETILPYIGTIFGTNRFNVVARRLNVSLAQLTCTKASPLYGAGSECTVPCLLFLSNLSNRTTQETNHDVQSTPTNLAWRSNFGGNKSLKPLPCTSTRVQVNTAARLNCVSEGRYLIQHAYGNLRLAFPFSFSTRMACVGSKNCYPEERTSVKCIIRLLQYRLRQLRRGNDPVNTNVIDIPDVWEEELTTPLPELSV